MSNTDTPKLQSPVQNQNSFTSLAFKWGSEELFRAAEAVEAMLATDGWQAVQRLVGEGVEFEMKSLFRQMAGNPVQVAQTAGRMEGLKGAEAAARAIRTAAESKRSQLEKEAAKAAEGVRG